MHDTISSHIPVGVPLVSDSHSSFWDVCEEQANRRMVYSNRRRIDIADKSTNVTVH